MPKVFWMPVGCVLGSSTLSSALCVVVLVDLDRWLWRVAWEVTPVTPSSFRGLTVWNY